MRLEGKAVIVTGGAQGLGRLYSEALAQEGARIMLADMRDATDIAREITQKGGTALAIKTDITSTDAVSRMVKETVDKYGRIDALINNAAIYYGLSPKPFTEIDPDEWDKVMQVNIKGTWLCSKAVIPQMRKQHKGKIINTSSGIVFSGTQGLLHYLASKAAIIGMTRGMARELGGDNICVNAVAPGMTWTESSKSMLSEEMAQRSVQKRCLKRHEQPEDLVGVIKFLVSDESDFITGQTIVVDGGSSLH